MDSMQKVQQAFKKKELLEEKKKKLEKDILQRQKELDKKYDDLKLLLANIQSAAEDCKNAVDEHTKHLVSLDSSHGAQATGGDNPSGPAHLR